MAYPRENLAPDERIVLHRHPHWKSLLGPFLLFLLVTLVAGVLLGMVTGADFSGSVTLWLSVVIGVLWLLVFGWFFVRPLVRWKTTHFVLTDRRVIYRTGVFTRSGIDIPVRRINTVEFRHGVIDRMLRTGTLVIESASDDPLLFHAIPQVERVHALLYHEVLDSHDDEDYPPGRTESHRRDGERR